MEISDEDKGKQDIAIVFAKKNKKLIAHGHTDLSVYPPDIVPVSIFMAGSPGAGKTEFSKNLIQGIEKDNQRKIIRIDADDLRSFVPGYTGDNSHLYQGAVSILVDKIHDRALAQRQSFVFDSTLSHYDKACENIRRSLAKKRPVYIFYLYQEPRVAWSFTEAREQEEGRHISKDAFIERFLGSMKTIGQLRIEFGDTVVMYFVKRDFRRETVENIAVMEENGKSVADLIGNRYTKEDLEKML